MHISCIYSSGGGNTRLVVNLLLDTLQQQKHDVHTINAINAQPVDRLTSPLTILAAPTYDHGILHAPFAKLLNKSSEVDLQGKLFAIIGLGDDKYDQEYTCEASAILQEFVLTHGGELLTPSLNINKSPVNHVTSIEHWATTLLTKIDEHGA